MTIFLIICGEVMLLTIASGAGWERNLMGWGGYTHCLFKRLMEK
jgi:hypothetical protein